MFNIGDGDYTFELSTDGIIPLVGSYRGIFNGDQSYEERIELHFDWMRVLAFLIYICVVAGLIYYARIRKKSKKEKKDVEDTY